MLQILNMTPQKLHIAEAVHTIHGKILRDFSHPVEHLKRFISPLKQMFIRYDSRLIGKFLNDT